MSEEKLQEAIIQPSEADNISQEEMGEIATQPPSESIHLNLSVPAVYPSAIGVQELDATTSQSTQI